jgi:ABC-2 type transport system ATP-binding protein
MSHPGESIVAVRGLRRSFGSTKAVDGLSFDVSRGEIFGLVGPDGAGKTTVMRILAGVLTADSGSVEVAGCDVRRYPESVKSHISYMPQRFGLYENLSIDENIAFYAGLFGVSRRQREEVAARLLALTGLSRFRSRLAGKLSGGMKQKLALICALIHEPQLVLLDEPTTGVDPISRGELWHLLYELQAQAVTLLIATAYLEEAERCNELALIHQGRLLACDKPEHLKRRMAGEVLRLVTPDPRSARDYLAAAEGVRNCVLIGDGIRLVVDNAELRMPELRSLMLQTELRFSSFEQVSPTIEDLFVAGAAGLLQGAPQ